MTALTPAGHARRAAAVRAAQQLLEQWGSPHAEDRAARLVDEVTAAGWCPPADLIRAPAPPARPASAEARAAALQAAADAVAASRGRRHLTPVDDDDPFDAEHAADQATWTEPDYVGGHDGDPPF